MFNGVELRGVCARASENAISDVQSLSDEEALGATVDELIEEITARHDMVEPVIDFNGKYVTEEGSGSSIMLHVPFAGTSGLFENQPNFFTSRWPDCQSITVVSPGWPAQSVGPRPLRHSRPEVDSRDGIVWPSLR